MATTNSLQIVRLERLAPFGYRSVQPLAMAIADPYLFAQITRPCSKSAPSPNQAATTTLSAERKQSTTTFAVPVLILRSTDRLRDYLAGVGPFFALDYSCSLFDHNQLIRGNVRDSFRLSICPADLQIRGSSLAKSEMQAPIVHGIITRLRRNSLRLNLATVVSLHPGADRTSVKAHY